MSFYDDRAPSSGFSIDLEPTTELVGRFHRTLMDRRHELPWEEFDAADFDDDIVAHARRQWAGRAVAEYQSTAQFAQLLHRLTRLGAPVEIIGAATRLATDECRHAELCARFADLLGGRDDLPVRPGGLSLFDETDDLFLAAYRTVLSVCCFGETLSVPMLDSLEVVASHPLPQAIAAVIAGDEQYHARFGWEVLEFWTPELDDARRKRVADRLPFMLGQFERLCRGGPEMLDRLAGAEVTVEEEPVNLGTLNDEQYAAIFYATLEETIVPRLTQLGFDVRTAWNQRVVPG